MKTTLRRHASMVAVAFAGLAFIATSQALKYAEPLKTKLTLSAANPTAEIRFRYEASQAPVLQFQVPEGHRGTLIVNDREDCKSTDGSLSLEQCSKTMDESLLRKGTAVLSVTALNPTVEGSTIEVTVTANVGDTGDKSFVKLEAL